MIKLWDAKDKIEAIRLYSKEQKSIGDIAETFDCTPDYVERMLNAEGQLCHGNQ